MNNDKFTMSTGQAHEFAMACTRNGATAEDIKLLSSGTNLQTAMNFIRSSLGHAVVPDNRLHISVNDSISSLITRGAYEWEHPAITEKFSFDSRTVGEWEFKVVEPKRYTPYEEARSLCELDGWSAARLEHLLAFYAKLEYEQDRNPLKALGSMCKLGVDNHIPGIWYSRLGGNLTLALLDDSSGRDRFLAVRRVINPLTN